jgi:hypothetical protein
VSKKQKRLQALRQQQVPQTFPIARFESDNLFLLMRKKVQADTAVSEYMLRLLSDRKLDPAVWGISGDFTKFEKIQQPQAPTPPPTISVQK